MRRLYNLNVARSIELKKLITEESFWDKFDTFTNYFMFLALILSSILCFGEIKPSANNSLEYIILTNGLIFSLYGLYCKFTEKYLNEIKFNIHREDAKQRILEYGKKYNYRISKISNDLIFLNEPNDSLGFGDSETTIMIFFQNNNILFTMIKECVKVNTPVLFSQHFIRRDFKKF